jgi:hypothetical protein
VRDFIGFLRDWRILVSNPESDGTPKRDPDEEDIQESIKLGFEAVKHLTTLSAGSTVLIGTFFTDIFRNAEGELLIGKWGLAAVIISFLAFGASLIVAAIAM